MRGFERHCFITLLLLAAFGMWPAASVAQLSWEQLPDIPTPMGGAFAGATDEALVVAGGAHFPEASPFEGGTKKWVENIYVLSAGASQWRRAGELPSPRAYGASISTGDGIIFVGGGDADAHMAEVLRLSLNGESVQLDALPPLPGPVAMMGAALLDSAIYIAGGQASPAAQRAMHNFWKLDLRAPESGWIELQPWPGPARILPVVMAHEGAVYLASGAELITDDDGSVTRRFLTDAYRYSPGAGWEQVPDVPHAVVAAPAASVGGRLLVFGGDSGEHFFEQHVLKDGHPGFGRDILAYESRSKSWMSFGFMPVGLVTTNAVKYDGGIVIPAGEDRPGHRAPIVLLARAPASSAAALGGFKGLDYLALGLYLALLVSMGFYFAGRENTTEDYFLAGRRIPWWAAGMSIFGTQLSAITFMAIPAKSFATDWVFFLVNMCIVLIAPVVIYFYLPFFRRLNVTTAYEYLERRFHVGVRMFGSVSFIVYQLARMGIVLALPAMALSTVTGISIYTAVLFMGVLATLYTVLGGIEAVIWTDVLQVVVLLGGALLSLILIAGGVDGGFGELVRVGRESDKFHMFNWSWDYTTTAVWVVLVGNFLSNLVPYTTDQTVIQRYLTTSDEGQARRAIWTNAALTIPASVLFFGVGTALFVFYDAQPALLPTDVATDAIFPFFIAQQLPAGVSGIIIAGLFAAAMSSLDSSMNSVATVIVTDFYKRWREAADDRQALRLARWLTLGLGVLGTSAALVIATFEVESLFDLILALMGLLGGSLAGVFALGIFTRRTTGHGALTGAFVSVIVLYLVQQYSDVHFFLYAAIGIGTCFTVGYVASFVLPPQQKSLEGLTYSLLVGRGGRQPHEEEPTHT